MRDYKMKGRAYSLHVRGVWGRKRKADFKSFTMGTDLDLPMRSKLEARALNMIAELRGKSGLRWSIVAYPCEHRDDGIQTIMITQSETLARGVVGGDVDWLSDARPGAVA